jgi:SRSO17 transposase
MEREKDGFKYYFASHSKSTALKTIVRLAKMRWHIERDYQDMKQNLGFDRYEGRSWGGLHRHLAMVAIMHAFISLHREAFSPCDEFAA